jgi:hypothetical protein
MQIWCLTERERGRREGQEKKRLRERGERETETGAEECEEERVRRRI